MKVDIRIAENARTDLTQRIGAADYFVRLEALLAEKLGKLPAMQGRAEAVEISVSSLSEPEMRGVNMEYREIDSATDVLSFPLWEENGVFDPPAGWDVLPLGDIVVCPDIIAKSAEEAKKSFIEELTLVLCHGALHLCGFDHDSEEREKEMWEEQNAMVSGFMEGAADA